MILASLAALDREIDSFRNVAADAVNVCAWSQPVEIYLLLIGNGDEITVRIEQLENDLLIPLILIDLSVKQRATQLKCYGHRRLARVDSPGITLVKAATGIWIGCR